jgi:hypothetical protein
MTIKQHHLARVTPEERKRRKYESNRSEGKTCRVCGQRILNRNTTGLCNTHRPQIRPKTHQSLSIRD